MKLTSELIAKVLWKNKGFTITNDRVSKEFKGKRDYMVFGAKVFINEFSFNPETGEEIFETREANETETRNFILSHMTMALHEIEEKEPDYKKIAAAYYSNDGDISAREDGRN